VIIVDSGRFVEVIVFVVALCWAASLCYRRTVFDLCCKNLLFFVKQRILSTMSEIWLVYMSLEPRCLFIRWDCFVSVIKVRTKTGRNNVLRWRSENTSATRTRITKGKKWSTKKDVRNWNGNRKKTISSIVDIPCSIRSSCSSFSMPALVADNYRITRRGVETVLCCE